LGSGERALTELEISSAEATPQIHWPNCIFSKLPEDLFEYRRARRSRTRLVAAVEGCIPVHYVTRLKAALGQLLEDIKQPSGLIHQATVAQLEK